MGHQAQFRPMFEFERILHEDASQFEEQILDLIYARIERVNQTLYELVWEQSQLQTTLQDNLAPLTPGMRLIFTQRLEEVNNIRQMFETESNALDSLLYNVIERAEDSESDDASDDESTTASNDNAPTVNS